MKARLLIVFGIAALAIAASSPAKAQTTMTWTVDGNQRQAIVFAPAPTTSKIKHPLVFGFHGHGGNMQGASQLMHIQTLLPEAIVVYPQGLNTPRPKDPPGNSPGWQFEANQARAMSGTGTWISLTRWWQRWSKRTRWMKNVSTRLASQLAGCSVISFALNKAKRSRPWAKSPVGFGIQNT